MPIKITPTRCSTCNTLVIIFNGITAEASGIPGTLFEDLLEHECSDSDDIENSGEDADELGW